jgi:hypothetical protein
VAVIPVAEGRAADVAAAQVEGAAADNIGADPTPENIRNELISGGKTKKLVGAPPPPDYSDPHARPLRKPHPGPPRRGDDFLAALEPHRQVVGDGVYRDPVLRHGVALANGDGVVLE